MSNIAHAAVARLINRQALARADFLPYSRLAQLGRDLVQSVRAHWIFFVVPLLYLGTNAWFMRGLHDPLRAPFGSLLIALLTITLPAALFALFIVRLVELAAIDKNPAPFRAMIVDVREFIASPRRIANGLPILIAMVLFNKATLELKPAIPLITPFAWDEVFMRLDRALHFGVDPWRLLQPLLGHDWITFAVNIGYNFWFLALFGLWFWFAFRPEFDKLRTRFFLSYMIAWWVGGGLLALFFSSAGPCYYGAIGHGDDPYAPLMSYLHDVDSRIPLWALDAQQLLWDGYTGKLARAFGISAFPSMHNAMAMIFALTGFRIHRWLGLLFTANVIIILLGSVHLGWHYAVDAYAGNLIGLAAWWIAGLIARWFHGLEASAAWNAGLSRT